MVTVKSRPISGRDLREIRRAALEIFKDALAPILKDLEKKIHTSEENLGNRKWWKFLERRRINRMRSIAGKLRGIENALKVNSTKSSFSIALLYAEQLSLPRYLGANQNLQGALASLRDHIRILARD